MIDISKAQAGQSTTGSDKGDWVVTLGVDELYRLPPHFTVQETFLVRDIIGKMMDRSAEEMKEMQEQLCLVKLQHVTSRGTAQLDALKRENERLADVLEQHLNREEN
jgi:hypothetical protein|tara:strand:+ start:3685 stop:4005 length:321 start_codon:yes stop_codon:yes gene_type:complete